MRPSRAACVLLLAALPLVAQTRRALVVGISEYKGLPSAPQGAPNARALARALTASQFQTALLIDVDAAALGREINKFLQELQPGDTGTFFFSGYAVQDLGENYLLPAGYEPAGVDGIEFQAYSVKRLIRYLETKKLAAGIVILDPAPPNAAIERKFPEPGLASMDLRAANLLLALANLPGRNTPSAPNRPLSRFTEAWVSATNEPGLSLDATLRQIKLQVSQATKGEQVPAEISTLVIEFAFQPRTPAATEWDRLSASRDPNALEAFRQRFPGDPLALEAAKRIEAIGWEQAKVSAEPNALREFLRRFPQHQEALQLLAARQTAERTKDADAIRAAIDRYSQAYQSRNIEAVQAARPGLLPSDRKRIEDAFRNFKSIRYTLTPVAGPVVEAALATVKCRLKVEMQSASGGSPPPADQPVTVKLRRLADSWVVDSIQ